MYCRLCKSTKEEKDFRTTTKWACRDCINRTHREWKRNNPDKIKANSLKYRNKNKDRLSTYYKEWYSKNGRNRDDKKMLAHKMVALAIRSGEMKRPKECATCRSEGKIEGHHADYNHPLEVVWLCNRCHRTLHPGDRKN